MADLEPAETNPWYVLSTLHGPQTGEEIDYDLAEKNVALWNIWSCQNLTEEERVKLREAGAEVPVADAWKDQKKEIEALYQERFFEMGFGRHELPDLPDVDAMIDMSKIVFSHTVLWEKTIFGQVADFSSATFAQDAYFPYATFAQTAYFTSATFAQDAYFRSAKFAQTADFSSATFAQTADFSSATFAQIADFNSAKFAQNADFISATFAQDVSFSFATFSGFAYFRETRFGTDAPLNEHYRISFADAIFERPTSFRDAEFKHRYPLLDGTVFHDKTQFTAERGFWPTERQPKPKQAKEACATLRHVMAKQSLPEDEGFFFRREMKFAGQSGSWPARPLYWIYGFVSDYGHSVWRPVAFLVALFVLFFPAYQGCVPSDGYCLFNPPAVRLLPAVEAAGLSFSNMFKFFGFQTLYYREFLGADALSNGIKIAASVQTILSFILLFFLGLGLRSRFRLR